MFGVCFPSLSLFFFNFSLFIFTVLCNSVARLSAPFVFPNFRCSTDSTAIEKASKWIRRFWIQIFETSSFHMKSSFDQTNSVRPIFTCDDDSSEFCPKFFTCDDSSEFCSEFFWKSNGHYLVSFWTSHSPVTHLNWIKNSSPVMTHWNSVQNSFENQMTIILFTPTKWFLDDLSLFAFQTYQNWIQRINWTLVQCTTGNQIFKHR